MELWYAKASSTGSYTLMKTPSSYKLEMEDLDADSYRSKATGNLIRTIVSKGWLKASFSYKYLTPDEYKTISDMIKNYPLYVKVKDPRFTGGYIECEVYCSKSSGEMLETGAYNMSFNLIQSKKGTWQ